MSRFTNHLTYANVTSTLCVLLLVGSGTAYAANTVFSTDIVDGEVKTLDIGLNQVTTGRIAPGNVFGADLANDSVNSSKVGANALTGADINESTLAGVNAGTVGGMSVKKINFQVPLGTAKTKILDFPGKFEMYAECQDFGDYLDVNIHPGENGTMIAGLSGYMNVFDDSNSTRDIRAVGGSYGAGTVYLVDNVFPGLAPKWARIDFGAPSGFVVHIDLLLSVFGDSCSLTGTAIVG